MHYTRICLLPLSLGLIVLLPPPISLPQTSPSASSLAKLSDKDLFKRAEAEDKAGRLENAREAILLPIQRAVQKKKKPDKKYQDLLDSLNTRLSDREAEAGEAACGRMELENCEKQIAAAKHYATTARVIQLEGAFNASVAKLRQEFQSFVALAEGGDPESALPELRNLIEFEAFLPQVRSATERANALFLQKLVDEGHSFIDEKRWEDASMRFQRVMELTPDDERVRAGLEKAKRGQNGYLYSSQAAEQLRGRRFDEAFRLIEAAITTYPEAKSEFERSREQITRTWVTHLLSDIPSLLQYQDDFQQSRAAYLRLQKVLQLDPQNVQAPTYLEEASRTFAANAAQHAQQLAEIMDLSRIATATVLKSEVQRLMPDLMPQEELKSSMGNFNRKRVSQLLLSVEDLASAPQDFTRTIMALTRNTIDKQGLRDLRVRSKEDYEKSPMDDLQFQYMLPDGKSYAAVLAVNITRYEFRRSPETSDLKSRYVFGTEKVPNEEYDVLSRQLNEIRRALDNPARKKDRPTPEGWTEATYQLKKSDLERTDKLIEKDKIIDYTYQRTQYRQNTNIEIDISVRDYYSKEQIAHKKIQHQDEREGVEISGVRETDVGGLQNQQLRLPDKDQALAEGERFVREELDKWIPQLLHAYTDRFFNEGEKALKAGRVEDAVENFLCHWAFFGGKLDPARMERIAETVKNLTAFDLHQHGERLMAQLLTVPVVQ